VRGVDGKKIKVASISYEQFYQDIAKGAQARFDIANQKKELPGGRQIDYEGLIDDKATADGTVQAERQAVEQDGVFAIVGSVAVYLTKDYINQQKVPWVGWGINDAFCSHGAKTPWYLYGITGCLNPTPTTDYVNTSWAGATLKQLESEGKPTKNVTAAVISEDNDTGKQGVATVAAGAKAAGLKVVYEKATIAPAPVVTSDWSPYVQDLMTSANGGPPDVFFNVSSVPNIIGLSTAMSQAGFTGIDTNSVGYSPQLVTISKGWTAYTQWATPESANEGNTEMAKIVGALNDAGVSQIGLVPLVGWFSADMFVGILKKVGKNLTPERFAKAAAQFSYEVSKTIGPTTYPQGFAAGTPCAQLATSNGSTFDVSASYGCYDVFNAKTNKLIPYSAVKNT
jgi:ABC-type branched-subunit amino acid transport system substrate-binding protein